MFKFLANNVWVYDVEWVPDVRAGRLAYALPDDFSDKQILDVMFARGGATEDNPRPYLKTALCRIVSIAVLKRSAGTDGTTFTLRSLPQPDGPPLDEREIIEKFLWGAGKERPQLVGFNSVSADLPAILQRAVANSVSAPGFCRRPDKPWEGADYFAKFSDWHVDLKDMLGGFGKATPSLNELAAACGIPAKSVISGGDVLDLWLSGNTKAIAEYNQRDVLTTYELLQRAALLAGHLSPEQYKADREAFSLFLTDLVEMASQAHIREYVHDGAKARAA